MLFGVGFEFWSNRKILKMVVGECVELKMYLDVLVLNELFNVIPMNLCLGIVFFMLSFQFVRK